MFDFLNENIIIEGYIIKDKEVFMSDTNELEVIDIKKEAKYIEDLMDKSFKHNFKENDIIYLVEKMYQSLEKYLGHIMLDGNYKSGLSAMISNRSRDILKFYKKNPQDFFDDTEYDLLKEFSFHNRGLATYEKFEKILKQLKIELKEDLNCLKGLKVKERDEIYEYHGFNSRSATHPGIEDALEDYYVKERINRHSIKQEQHIYESILTHLGEVLVMNNDLKMKMEIEDYIKHQERDPEMAYITKEDKGLLKMPYFKLLQEILKDDADKEALIEQYITKNGIFEDKKEKKSMKKI